MPFSFIPGVSMTNYAGTIDLAAWPAAQIETVQVANATPPYPSERAWGIEDISAMSIVSFVYPEADGGYSAVADSSVLVGGQPAYRLELLGVVDNTPGVEALVVTPKITMGANAAVTTAFRYVEILIALTPTGSVADWRVILPGPQPTIRPWSTILTSEKTWSHPGIQDRGGESAVNITSNPSGDTGLVGYDEPANGLRAGDVTFHQWVAVRNESTGAAFLIRARDTHGYGKVISMRRETGTDKLIIGYRMAPPDCSMGNQNRSDWQFPYGIEMAPVQGSLERIAIIASDREKYLDQNLGYARGRIIDRPAIGVNAYPPLMRQATGYVALVGGNREAQRDEGGATPPNPIPFDFASYYEEPLRIKNRLGAGDRRLVTVFYDTQDGLLGENFPLIDPMINNSAYWVRQLYLHGMLPMAYTIPVGLQEGQSTSLTLILAELSRTRQGYVYQADLTADADDAPITGETPLVAARFGGTSYAMPTWATDAAVLEVIRYYVGQFLTILGPYMVGSYNDVGWALMTLNDDFRVTPAERGFGNTVMGTRLRRWIELYRQVLAEFGFPGAILINEHPINVYITHADAHLVNTLGPSTYYQATMAYESIAYGEYSRFMTFLGPFGYSPARRIGVFDLDFPGFADHHESFASFHSFWFMKCIMFSQVAYFQLREEFFVARANEVNYDAASEDVLDFIERLYFKQPELVAYWQVQRRLESPPSSQILLHIEAGCAAALAYATEFGISGDPEAAQAAADVAAFTILATSAAYIHKAILIDDNGVIATKLANWTRVGGTAAYTGTFSDTITTAGSFPELGAAPLDVYVTDFDTGITTQIAGYDGGGSYTYDVAMAPGDVKLVRMVPVGYVLPEQRGLQIPPFV